MVEDINLDVEWRCVFHHCFQTMTWRRADVREVHSESLTHQMLQVTECLEFIPSFCRQQKKIQVTFHQRRLLDRDFSGTECFAVLALCLLADD